jgi:RNA:NAD 2'-phosphotransferase (TPT1/KptA family)
MYLSSPTIVFHGTVSSVLDSILREGFKAPPGESVHFAKGSTLALSVACQRRSRESPKGVVIAVRFESLFSPGITNQSDTVLLNTPGPQPEILAYCVVPPDFRLH